MTQNLPHREEAFAISWMKIFVCLSPARVAAAKPTQLCTSCENLLFIMTKFTFFTPNQHQDKIVDLQKVMKPISKKVGYEVLELHSPEEILDTSEYPSNNRKVVVFDDLVNAPDRIQSKIANHWTDGRHHGISPIYLSQSYYDVPQKIRLNCSHMILYPPATKKHVDLIAKENLVQPNLFQKLGPFEFLFLDKEKKSVAKNFDEKI